MNVDLILAREDEMLIITGNKKLLDFDVEYFYLAKGLFDFYHRYKEDITLFAEIKFRTYRMSIA